MATRWSLTDSQSGSIFQSGREQDSLLLEDFGEEDIDGQGVELSSLPPLVIVSSRVKRFMSLVRLANPGVAVVHYEYQSTSLNKLLQSIGDILKSRKAYSIAFVVHGQPGHFKLNSEKTVTLAAIKEDQELQQFFKDLVSNYLYTGGDLARIDILSCPVEQIHEGKQLIQALSELIGVPVYASEDIWGAELPNIAQDGPVKIGTLYFDVQRLKDWSTQTHPTLDKYEKIRTVGQGAYGQAVLYRRKDDDSRVILKKINILELNKTERQSVVTEIKILSMLDHPHIISYYDNFEEEGVMMIEMEYADGGSLQQFLKQQQSPLSELDVLTKFSQMVGAICYIHMHNILHRDLKTANIFLTRHGIVKLGDFGISKVLSATNQAAHTVVGTPYYISPEICEGKYYDAKSDIWSLGCILYEMLCLQKTFEGTNLPALVHKIVEGSFEPVKGKYSNELKQLVRKMLEKNPADRPSASEMHTRLIPILLVPLQKKAGVLPSNDHAPPDDSNTKSFLYQLDGHSLLLKPVVCPLQEKISHVAVGYSHIVVVTSELKVYSWGENSRGQLGLDDYQPRNVPVLIESLNGRNIKSAECGGEFSIFMNENGIVMSCGRGDKGVLGHGNYRDSCRPEMIQELLAHDCNVLSCGESHVAMVTMEGKVFVWGCGDCGRLGTGSGDHCCQPTEITIRSPGTRMNEVVRDIRCGLDATVFITDVGRLFACGNNTDNKLGLNRRETFIMQMKKLLNKQQLQVACCSVPTPIKELGKHRVIDCSLGPTHSSFLTDTGLVYTFGRNIEGQLGTGNCLPREMPTIVKGLNPRPIRVKSTELATIVATENNSFFLWGSRPIVRSHLTSILSGVQDQQHVKPSDLCSSPDSGFRDSLNSSPETKGSSEESIITKSKQGSNETVNGKMKSTEVVSTVKQSQESLQKQSGSNASPTLNHRLSIDTLFTEIPHAQVVCHTSSDYLSVIYKTLNILQSSKPFSRQTSGVIAQVGGKLLKKGGSLIDVVNADGVVLKPLSVNLVETSGILNNLWEQGLQDVKLEEITCFGCNLVVLIYGQISDNKISEINRKKSTFIVSERLRRSLVSITPLPLDMDQLQKSFSPDTLHEESEDEDEEGGEEMKQKKTYGSTVLSQTSELPPWLKEDLQEGIPMSDSSISYSSSSQSIQNSVDESHGWFPQSMTRDSKMYSSDGKLSMLSDSIVTSGDTVKKIGTVEPSKHGVSGNTILSGRKGSKNYHAVSRSAGVMHRTGVIPDTIEEHELESTSKNSIKLDLVNNQPPQETSTTGSTVSNTDIPHNPKPTFPSPSKKVTLEPINSDNLPPGIKSYRSPLMLMPAKSIAELPIKSVGPMGVKRVHSSGNVSSEQKEKVEIGVAGKGKGLQSHLTSSTGQTTGRGRPTREKGPKIVKSNSIPSNVKISNVSLKKKRSLDDDIPNGPGVLQQPPKKTPSGSSLSKHYQTGISPYSKPLSRNPRPRSVRTKPSLTKTDPENVKNEASTYKVKDDLIEAEKKKKQEDLERQMEKEEELIAAHEREKEELERKAKEEIELAKEKEERMIMEINELKERVEKMEADKDVIKHLQEQISSVQEKQQSPVDSRRKRGGWFRRGRTTDTENSPDENRSRPTSRFCNLM